MKILVLAATMVLAGCSSMQFRTDQPHQWANPYASHHWKHGAGGAMLGATAYEGATLAGAERLGSYGAAAATGAAVGYGYELWMGRDGTSLVDPVDAGWVTAGALVGAAAADLTNGVMDIRPVKDGVTVGVALEW